MLNLLHDSITRDQVVDILKKSSGASFLPPLGDARWEKALSNPVMADVRDALLEREREDRETPMPVLTEELYLDFGKTGTRRHFEAVYFERRRRLARSGVALLAAAPEERDRALACYVDTLQNIFDEDSWTLPAHVPDTTGRRADWIDLFASETANVMAESVRVFGAILPGKLKERIAGKLERDYFLNYRDNYENYNWREITNNWNSVCHQGVIGAALAAKAEPELLADLLMLGRRFLPNYLKGFDDDGGCSEGPAYWSYGFGWFAVLNEQLETYTDGALSLFEGDKKVNAIARYGAIVQMDGGFVVNFADCSPGGLMRAPTLQYLGERLQEPDCLRQAAVNFARLGGHPVDVHAERSDTFYWFRSFLYCPRETSARAPAGDAYLENCGVWIARGRDAGGHLWEAAAKAGHNEEHHNHNDIASLLLHIDGRTLLSEIGRSEYNREYFGPGRYKLIATRGMGHSIPIINGEEQMVGAQYTGKVIKAVIATDPARIEIDASKAYPAAAKVKSFIRRVELEKIEGKLMLEDDIDLEGEGDVEFGFITLAPEIHLLSDTQARIHNDGRALILTCGPDMKWDRVDRHTYLLPYGGKHGVAHRVILLPDARATSFRCRIEMRLANRR